MIYFFNVGDDLCDPNGTSCCAMCGREFANADLWRTKNSLRAFCTSDRDKLNEIATRFRREKERRF